MWSLITADQCHKAARFRSRGATLALLRAPRPAPSMRRRFPRKHLSTGMAAHVHLCRDPRFAESSSNDEFTHSHMYLRVPTKKACQADSGGVVAEYCQNSGGVVGG